MVWGLSIKAGLFPASADKGVALGHFCSDLVLIDGLGLSSGKDLSVDEVSEVRSLFCNARCSVARDL